MYEKLEEAKKAAEEFFNKLGIDPDKELPSPEKLAEILEKNPGVMDETLVLMQGFKEAFKETRQDIQGKV